MSLINQMLQDLEKRQSGTDVNLLSSVRTVRNYRSMKLFWALLLLLLLAAAGVIGWLLWDKYSPMLRGPAAVDAPTPAKPIVVAEAPPPAAETKVEPEKPVESVQETAPQAAMPPLNEPAAQPVLPKPVAAPPAAKPAAPTPSPKPVAPAPVSTAASGRPAAANPAAAVSKQVKEPTPQQRAESEYRKALSLAQSGRISEAINGLELAVRIDPRHAAATQTLIGLLLESKRFGEAERRLQEALSLDPGQPDLAMTLARLQVERGDTGAAIATLDRSQYQAANRAEYFGFMAALLQREGYHREAIVQYRQALRLSPGNAVWLMGLGISLQAEKNFREAREAFSRARVSNTLSPELQAFVEQRLKQLGQ